MEREPQDGMEPVGDFEMCATIGAPTPDSDERWERRVTALADWLMCQWQSAAARDGAHDAAA
jgi:hypothetical protein